MFFCLFVCLFFFYNGIKSDFKLSFAEFLKDWYYLGPLLFILYINDITNTSTLLDFILFADDTTILFSSDDICSETDKINKELSEISNWFRANKLPVNASKTN